MLPDSHLPDTESPAAGRYAEVNAFGAPTGVVVEIGDGGWLPPLPSGSTWRLARRPCLSEMSPVDLLSRAIEHRRMAATATTADVRDALLRIATRFADMARDRLAR